MSKHLVLVKLLCFLVLQLFAGSPIQAQEQASADAVIKAHCTKEWPDDFEMRAHCERKQYEAIKNQGR